MFILPWLMLMFCPLEYHAPYPKNIILTNWRLCPSPPSLLAPVPFLSFSFHFLRRVCDWNVSGSLWLYQSIGPSFYGWDWLVVWKMDGCKNNCVQLVHKLSIVDILTYHHQFSELPKNSKKQWILDFLKMNTSSDETAYSICGKQVCFQVWLTILGLSQSYFYKVRSLFRCGIVNAHLKVQ